MEKDAIRFFIERYGLSLADIDSLLSAAMVRGGDYADLYFEYRISNSIGLEEDIIKSATRSVSQGVGVRVVIGDKTGYAYTDEIEVESIKRAAETAGHIARSGGARQLKGVDVTPSKHNLYPVEVPLASVDLAEKIGLVEKCNAVARGHDRRIREVQISL
ncbi:MAG: PmbA/TldA family metallopeptidase, partial [Blastocatellia bacterium]